MVERSAGACARNDGKDPLERPSQTEDELRVVWVVGVGFFCASAMQTRHAGLGWARSRGRGRLFLASYSFDLRLAWSLILIYVYGSRSFSRCFIPSTNN